MGIDENCRRPKNIAEGQFYDLAVEKGWDITNRGWPDFFLEKDGQLICVEVKPSQNSNLRSPQRRIMSALSAYGIPCYMWSPDGGFEVVQPSATVRPQGERGLGSSNTPRNSEDPQTPTTPPFDSPKLPPSRDGTEERRAEVDRIWACYVQYMTPRQTRAGEDERKIIRAALKVANATECCQAIEGCAASGYHMGDNPRRRKYNKISHILKGKHGRKTTREQIDMFLDIREKAVASGTAVLTSVDPALVAQRKDDVRRGFRLKGDPDAQRRAEAAEKWLKEHGVPTQRRADGYPLWLSGGNG